MQPSIDFNAPGGAKLKRLLEERLVELRLQNDNPNLTESATQFIRGGLMEIKRLLSPSGPVLSTPDYGGNSTGGVQ